VSPALDQQIRFCTSSDGARIAYATVGSGPPLVKAANWLSHLEFDSNSPVWRHWIRELSRHHTLVRYDERGCGLSDWAGEEFSLEAWVRDLEAVVDALELERFPLLGISQGGPIAIAYATRHPERVSRLILYGSYARGRSHRQLSDHEREEREVMLRLIRVGWGKDHPAFRQVFTSLFIPDATPEQTHWFNELQRVSATPENAARICTTFDTLDVREQAARLEIPTLVLHGTGDLRVPFQEGRLLASLIPGARFVPIEGRNHILLESETGWRRFLQEVRSFLGVPVETPDISASRRRRIEALFDEALEAGPDDRAGFLARVGGDDPELRREVEALLAVAEQSGVTAKLAAAWGRPSAHHNAVPPAPTISQYEIVEQLGGGGMGVVYKARDRRLQRFVALKFLPPSLSAQPELKLRFLQEAKAIASLDHPNLCTIFEVAEPEDGQLVIVMPYYEGETLKQKIARGPLSLAQALDYALQIAGGLAHAHAAGVVHRDIKPANIIVTSGDRVKVLDFGVAKVSDANAKLTRTGAVLGTLAYMSPEQSSGEPVDHRSDLWALGVVLYEMLTGRPPFTADSLEALFYAIQWRDPVGAAGLRPEVPPALEALVHRLLEKEPARRYDDALALAASLESVRAEVTRPPEPSDPDAPSQHRAPARSRLHLVGRRAELRRLGELFRDACRGVRQLAFVAGEPGVGKSCLVEMFLQQVHLPGQLRIGRGQCLDQRGAGEPYMPVLEALGRLCRERDGAELLVVLERYAPTWLAQMPSLLDAAQLEAVQRRAFGATRDRMLREMVEALDAFTVDTPLLLLLEDLHWSDPSTLDLIMALAHRPEPAQLLVLGTYRPSDAPDGLAELVRTLRSQGRCAQIALDVWPEADARAYLAARCAPGALPPGVVDLVLRRTDGHPLFVRSLMDEWQETGALVRDGAEWRLGGDLEQLARTVPESLRASIEQRIDGLSPAHQELLEAASVAGAEFEVAAVGAALDREDEALETQLRRLTRQGWVTATPAMAEWPDGTLTARYAFGHHLHQELLYARLSLSRRARLHQRIGCRLESAYGDGAAERAGELALHFSRARDDERTARYHRYAAEHAMGRNAYPEAIAHLTAALEILQRRPELPDARRVELTLQRMLGPALRATRGWGDPDAERAYNRARELSELLEDSEQLASALYGLAYLYEYRGDYLRAQALLEERLALRLPREEPGPLLEAHELLSCSLFHQGSFERALRHAREGLDLIGPDQLNPVLGSSRDNAAIACLFWSGLSSWFLGRPDEAAALVQRGVELCNQTGQTYMLAFGAAQAARLFQHRRESDRVAEHAERAIAIAEREGYPYPRAIGRTFLGWAEVMSGTTSSGLLRLRLGVQGQAELGASMERPYSLGLLADALAHAGQDEAALAGITEALALPETRERSFFWEAELHRLRGVLLLRQRSPQGAEGCFRRAIEIAALQSARSLELRSAVSLCRLHRETGQAPDAPGLLLEVFSSFREGFDTPDLREAGALLKAERTPAP
jgi:pimeloyl-ACP methyl ester carboxylesterase/tRNA A-37 threonylcarbamoyl transferase component Bud32/tetratricopeptide (TPR) repeat protein